MGGSSLYTRSQPSWPDPAHSDSGFAAFSCSPHSDLGTEGPGLETALGSSPSPRGRIIQERVESGTTAEAFNSQLLPKVGSKHMYTDLPHVPPKVLHRGAIHRSFWRMRSRTGFNLRHKFPI